MGLAGLSLGHILLVLLVVILVFGTKKLGNIGSDLGTAIKGFRKAMASSDDQESAANDSSAPNLSQTASPQAPTKRAESGSSGASRQ